VLSLEAVGVPHEAPRTKLAQTKAPKPRTYLPKEMPHKAREVSSNLPKEMPHKAREVRLQPPKGTPDQASVD